MINFITASFLFFTFSFQLALGAEIRGCHSEQTTKIHETEKLIALRLDQLLREWTLVDLAGVKRDFVDPGNRQWVPGSAMNQSYETYWQAMRKVFSLMKVKADRGLNFQCQSARETQCKNGSIAYVMTIFGRPKEMIYLCPAFFEYGMYTTTVFHELSHYAAFAQDYTLDWSNLERSDLKRGAKDAYHIEVFMNQDVEFILKRNIWLWWWPKKS